MKKLPKKFKEKWITALRSGEYKQCKHQLHNNWGHCCLGVAEIVLGLKTEDNEGFILLGKKFPKAITGTVNNNLVVATLAFEMNDSGKSFEEIADWIETNL